MKVRAAGVAVLVAGAGVAAALGQPQAGGAGQRGETVALTIYSSARPGAIPADTYRPIPPSLKREGGYAPPPAPLPGFAVVKQERVMTLPHGRGPVEFADVAALLDPTTVMFESLTDPGGTTVLDQSYQFDLVSAQKMLERYVGKQVSIDGTPATLLSASAGGGLLVREGGGAGGEIVWKQKYDTLRFPELAAGLILKPTLVWDVLAQQGGEQRVRVSYQTEGMVWWADYNLVLTESGEDANTGTLDVGAWVSILNQSGASYPDARLKLIAGDVHRAPTPQPVYAPAAARAAPGGRPEGFEEKPFFEYHLYTLGRPATIADQSTRQIELFEPARHVPAEKVLVYAGQGDGFRGVFAEPMVTRDFGTESNTKVDVYLRFKNARDHGLGIPLHSGRIRVSKMDPADKTLEFIGEDVIDHTPKDEPVLVRMGAAFDVVGERRQVDFSVNTREKWMEETVEIKVRNHKAQPVRVIVRERLNRWATWAIPRTTIPSEKVDARTVQFPLQIAPDQEGTLRYTVRYTW